MKCLITLFFFINLFNYIDRGLIASFNINFINNFNITNTQSGLINSSFIIGYMILSPLFSYLIYKYNKIVLIFWGLLIWSISNFVVAFSYNYYLFLFARIFVGAGEASFGTIVPPIIDSISPKDRKSTYLSIYFLAIPLGYALGFLFGGLIEQFINWHFSFMIESILMLILSFILLGFRTYLFKIERTEALLKEDYGTLEEPKHKILNMNFKEKIKTLFKNKIFIFSVLAYSFYTYVIGSFSYWGPVYLIEQFNMKKSLTNYIFGGITVGTGIIGSFLGGFILDKFRNKYNMKTKYSNIKIANRICFISILSALFLCLITFSFNNLYFFIIGFIFIELGLFIITGPINSMILWSLEEKEKYTINLNDELKTFGCSLSILSIHLLGDIPSPIITGAIQDLSKNWNITMLSLSSVLVLGSVFFVINEIIVKKY